MTLGAHTVELTYTVELTFVHHAADKTRNGGFREVSGEVNARTVLVVDDEPGVLMSFEGMLRLGGYTVVTVDNAVDALREARRCRPDAILLDLRMPQMDGRQFLEQLRTEEAPRRTPVAIVTGDYLLDDSAIISLKDLGAEVRLKPLWLDDLMTLVDHLVCPPSPQVN